MENNLLNIEIREKKELTGPTGWVRTILYFPKNEIIFSGGMEKEITVWNCEDLENIEIMDKINRSNILGDRIYQMLKWNDESFFCCSIATNYGYSCVSIHHPYNILRTRQYKRGVYQILKLDEDRLLALTRDSEFEIYSYSQSNIIKKLTMQFSAVFVVKKLFLSKLFPHSFYYNSDMDNKSLKLINYEKDEITFGFDNIVNESFGLSTIFSKKKKVEYVIYGSCVSIILFELRQNDDSNKVIGKKLQEINGIGQTYSMCSISNKYILSGGNSGDFKFYEFQKDSRELVKLKEKEIHLRKPVYDFEILKAKDNLILIVSGGRDNVLRLTEISGVKIENDDDDTRELEIMDLQERIVFLKDDIDSFLFSEEDKKKIFINIRVMEMEFCLIRSIIIFF